MFIVVCTNELTLLLDMLLDIDFCLITTSFLKIERISYVGCTIVLYYTCIVQVCVAN